MTSKDDVREFLISRRTHVTPEQTGFPTTEENVAYRGYGGRKL